MKKNIALSALISLALAFSLGNVNSNAQGVIKDEYQGINSKIEAESTITLSDKKNDSNSQKNSMENFLKKVENTKYAISLQSMSLEELKETYKRGARAFEIRLSATSDDNLVLADNFDQYYETYYDKKLSFRPTIDIYQENNMTNGQKMTLGDLNQFINLHPDAIFFVNTYDMEKDCIAILDRTPMKNKDNLIVMTNDISRTYPNIKNLAIKDLSEDYMVKNAIEKYKDKNLMFIYQNTTPDIQVRETLKDNNIVVYEYDRSQETDDLYYGRIYSQGQINEIIFNAPGYAVPKLYTRPNIKNDKFIAHAGGKYAGIKLSNSKQAMDNSYDRGCRMIEIDFDYTTDGKAVQVHDWGNFNRLCKDQSIRNIYLNYDEFKGHKLIYNLTQMSIDDTIKWLKEHKDAYIITDIKEDNLVNANVVTLGYVAKKAPELVERIIPQIYSIEQYQEIKDLGYKNIIFTLYRSNISPNSVLEFTKCNDIFAVTLDKDYRIKTSLPGLLTKNSQRVYTHTVNDTDEANKIFESLKAYGIYSDSILNKSDLDSKVIF